MVEYDQPQLQPPQIKSSPYQSPMHMYGSAIITMTNPEDELYKMELSFRSLKVDTKGNPHSVGDALMNDYGINAVIGTVQSLVNRVTIMSNLTKNDVHTLIDFMADTLARDLMVNRVVYDIKSFAARDKIFFTTVSTTFVTVKRAFEEGDKRFWKGSVQEIHSKVEAPAQRSSGPLSFLNPWAKR